MRKIRTIILITFGAITLASAYFALQTKFKFSFEDFFPKDDPDLAFYQTFIEDFETDINFVLIAVEKKSGVFEEAFLKKVDEFTIKAGRLPYIKNSNSLTQVSYPIKTPFGITTIPAIHIKEPSRYEKDKQNILADERFRGSLISDDATSLVIACQTQDSVFLEESSVLITSLDSLAISFGFDDYYVLGPSYFQKEMVAMQKREVTVSAIVSGILVSLVMFWIFRRPWGVFIALISIGLGLLIFLGVLSALGRPLNAMAALYPVLMIIVGTSDVIHIMTKYIDELKKGLNRREAITIAIKEIGMATLLTSITTAIGFASLLTSKIGPIREFGINAAIGVMIAYVTVIFFTTALLSMFEKEQLIKLGRGEAFWDKLMNRSYLFTRSNQRNILVGLIISALVGLWGISLATTNYNLSSNLPRGEKITRDFSFFETNFAGFRPFELAVVAKDSTSIETFAAISDINKVENKLRSYEGIEGVNSITSLYKSVHRMMNRNKVEYYDLPESEADFDKYKKLVTKVPANTKSVLLSKGGDKARITARVKDMGADRVTELGEDLKQWINTNVDTSQLTFHQTGMGVIIDKNATYIRQSLMQGLGIAILIISILMVLLFKNWRLVIISLVPNLFPLVIAGAMLGFLGIELDSGVSIVFAIVFGIAVDDTIHFLSKYKLARDKGKDIEASLLVTFLETGKAICLTSVILFFGFLVMLFSIHPPSVTIGLLISLTLISALLADLLAIPLLIRWLMKE